MDECWCSDVDCEVGEGYYLLYNVGTGQFFTRGNNWDTQASISVNNPLAVELISFEGKYKIRTGINGQDYGAVLCTLWSMLHTPIEQCSVSSRALLRNI